MVGNTSLVEIIRGCLASDELQLPVFQPTALKLQAVLAHDDFNINKVATIVTEDQALASQILRAANSAFFAGLSKVPTMKEAIVRLGSKRSRYIVTVASQQNNYISSGKIVNIYIESLSRHAFACAMGTKWLARKIGHKDLSKEAFLAGLLHDIGKLFLLKILEDIHTSNTYDISLSKAIIEEVMECMHAEQGYMLLQQWNLPETYCEVARDHHKEDFDTNNELLMMVRLVNLACHKIGVGIQHDPSVVLAVSPEAQGLETSEVLLAELEIMLEDILIRHRHTAHSEAQTEA
jgi:HD-like signal output (HDOD) protein